MAAAVSEEPVVTPVETVPGTGGGGGGFADFDPGGGDGRGDDGRDPWRPGIYRTAMWSILVSVTILFFMLGLVYVLRSRTPDFWKPIHLPRMLIASTAVLLVSSATCEAARRTLNRSFLTVTLTLGCVFLGMQVQAWRELAAEGAFVEANPHSFFFFMFTGVHGMHLFAGILMLWYLLIRAMFPSPREKNAARVREHADVATLYWHFMGALWLGLFLLLWFRG
jgi:cytochrome c oxidase subunit 3